MSTKETFSTKKNDAKVVAIVHYAFGFFDIVCLCGVFWLVKMSIKDFWPVLAYGFLHIVFGIIFHIFKSRTVAILSLVSYLVLFALSPKIVTVSMVGILAVGLGVISIIMAFQYWKNKDSEEPKVEITIQYVSQTEKNERITNDTSSKAENENIVSELNVIATKEENTENERKMTESKEEKSWMPKSSEKRKRHGTAASIMLISKEEITKDVPFMLANFPCNPFEDESFGSDKILLSGVPGQYNSIFYYFPSKNQIAVDSPDDNYYHWGGYIREYSTVREDDEDIEKYKAYREAYKLRSAIIESNTELEAAIKTVLTSTDKTKKEKFWYILVRTPLIFIIDSDVIPNSITIDNQEIIPAFTTSDKVSENITKKGTCLGGLYLQWVMEDLIKLGKDIIINPFGPENLRYKLSFEELRDEIWTSNNYPLICQESAVVVSPEPVMNETYNQHDATLKIYRSIKGEYTYWDKETEKWKTGVSIREQGAMGGREDWADYTQLTRKRAWKIIKEMRGSWEEFIKGVMEENKEESIEEPQVCKHCGAPK